MSFSPVIPSTGIAGWAFLKRTQDAQQNAFNKTPQLKRDTEYFIKNISSVKKSDDLISDYRLLRVALGAFGLENDINSKHFVKKVLDGGTLEPSALANKLSDKRYYEFAKAFGFGDFNTPRTQLSDFGKTTAAAYQKKQFEISIGNQDKNMRLALSLERELSNIVKNKGSEDTKWYKVMGNPPLREVFETAFGLPSSFGALDIDRQLSTLREKADRYFKDSSVSQFSDPGKREELNRLFLARAQIDAGSAALSSGSIALTLLQNA